MSTNDDAYPILSCRGYRQLIQCTGCRRLGKGRMPWELPLLCRALRTCPKMTGKGYSGFCASVLHYGWCGQIGIRVNERGFKVRLKATPFASAMYRQFGIPIGLQAKRVHIACSVDTVPYSSTTCYSCVESQPTRKRLQNKSTRKFCS